MEESNAETRRSCYKCKSFIREKLYWISKEVACEACFKRFIEKGFCKTLRTKCFVQKNFPLVVAFSGGVSSLCLLHIVKNTLLHEKNRCRNSKLYDDNALVHAVYIDLASIFFCNESDTSFSRLSLPPLCHFDFSHNFLSDDLLSISLLMRDYVTQLSENRFRFHCIDPIQLIFNHNNICLSDRLSVSKSIRELHFNSDKDITSLEDLLYIIRDRALFLWSQQLGNSCAMLFGHSATRLSTVALHHLCRGGGSQIPLLSKFDDARFSIQNISRKNAARFVRPIKKFSMFELHQYLSILGENITASSALQCKSETFRINEFFKTAQANNSQTVYTVTQTLEKLSSTCIKFSSDSQAVTFPYGRCQCCFGCMESRETKLKTVSVWTTLQFRCIGELCKQRQGSYRESTERPPSEILSQWIPKMLPTYSMEVILDVLSPLCVFCCNLAASCPNIRDVVFLLVKTGNITSATGE